MTENIFNTIKDLLLTDALPKRFRYILLLILFSEFIIIITNKLFPLYNLFLSIYPQGLTNEIIIILEISFYISFTLSAIYSMLTLLFLILDIAMEKCINLKNISATQYEQLSSCNKTFSKISQGCSTHLCTINEFLLIVTIPLITLNEYSIINSVTNYPLLSLLVFFMFLCSSISTLSDIINCFFST